MITRGELYEQRAERICRSLELVTRDVAERPEPEGFTFLKIQGGITLEVHRGSPGVPSIILAETD